MACSSICFDLKYFSRARKKRVRWILSFLLWSILVWTGVISLLVDRSLFLTMQSQCYDESDKQTGAENGVSSPKVNCYRGCTRRKDRLRGEYNTI